MSSTSPSINVIIFFLCISPLITNKPNSVLDNNVEAIFSKVNLMMPKNQESSKVSSKDSRVNVSV